MMLGIYSIFYLLRRKTQLKSFSSKHFSTKPLNLTDSVGDFWLLGTNFFLSVKGRRFIEGAGAVHRLRERIGEADSTGDSS